MEFCSPSRFLRDIDPQYLHIDKQSSDFSRPAYHRSNSFGRWDYVPGEEYIDRLHTSSAQRYWQEESPKPKPVVPHTKIRTTESSTIRPSSTSLGTAGIGSTPSQTGSVPPARFKRVNSTLVSPKSGGASSFLSTLQVGQKIQHERFGIGEVIKVEGTGDNAKATISFLHAGQKQLLLRFARFKIIY